MALIKAVFALGPLLFGIGFLAPLLAQSMEALAWTAPFGLTNLIFALIPCTALGVLATLRGRWV